MTLRPPHIVDVKRDLVGQIRGYVVSRNSQLTVVREFDGFAPGGFVALPTSMVVDLTINEPWTGMIASEGHIELAAILPWFATVNLRAALASIREREVNVKIECENCPDAGESGFHIGRIIEMHDSSLDFVFFDSTGRWFASPYSIPYTSITQLVVDDPYVTTFSRYAGPCPVASQDRG
tara:strand:- start:660 stop:1196 length:537 start_codon:yes stop_codon:yes gene_type:complete